MVTLVEDRFEFGVEEVENSNDGGVVALALVEVIGDVTEEDDFSIGVAEEQEFDAFHFVADQVGQRVDLELQSP